MLELIASWIGRVLRSFVLALVCATGVLFAACEVFLPSDPGIRGATGVRKSNGDIVVRVRACGEPALVSRVELNLSGRPNDVLWRIEAPAGSQLSKFTIGHTPADFEETTRLVAMLEPGIKYYIDAGEPNQTLGVTGVTFDPGHLDTETWLVDLDGGAQSLTDEEFDELDPCY